MDSIHSQGARGTWNQMWASTQLERSGQGQAGRQAGAAGLKSARGWTVTGTQAFNSRCGSPGQKEEAS